MQEARLGVALHGPHDVPFGKSEVYRIEVSNTGTADAENVVLTLSPSSHGERLAPVTHRLDTVGAGQTKTVKVELTASQDGNLMIQVEVRGDGAVRAPIGPGDRRATGELEGRRRGAQGLSTPAPKPRTASVFAIKATRRRTD